MGFRQKRSLLLLLVSLVFVPGSESVMEHHIIFFPDRVLVATPALYELAYQEVRFPAADGTALLDARYDNLSKIGQIRVPLLMFQGDRDRIVSPAMARQLFDAANEPKTWCLIPGADHNNTYEVGGEDYWKAWSVFLGQVVPACYHR